MYFKTAYRTAKNIYFWKNHSQSQLMCPQQVIWFEKKSKQSCFISWFISQTFCLTLCFSVTRGLADC